jgi:uncharacterized OsmC-like protein
MNADELRALQKPFKDRYRDNPPSAMITLRAEGRLTDDLACLVKTHGRREGDIVEAGMHPGTGGTGERACSAVMLLEALVGCAGVTMSAVAAAMGLTVRGGSARAEGDMDFRGTLGVAKDVPVGFQDIRLRFELGTNASDEQLATLVRLTERYCVVFQTLAKPPRLTVAREAA